MAENKAKIPEDDFVSKVVKDPKHPPDTLLLSGFLGKSSEEGHTRLYFDPELKSYVEIPQEAIQHWQEISKEVSPLGGYHVWINPNADLIHGKVGPQRTKAKFLQGPIGAAAAGVGAGGAQPAMPSTQFCGYTSLNSCPPSHHYPHCFLRPETSGFPCYGPDFINDPRVRQAPTLSFIRCGYLPNTMYPCIEFDAAANQRAAQAVAPQVTLPSAHPVCPTLFQHCPSFGCPVTAGCPSAACTLNLVQCGFQPNTIYPCRGFDVAADPRAAQAQATLPSAHPVCPTLFQHCPSFGCVVTRPCPSTACTLTPENCLHGTGIPCI